MYYFRLSPGGWECDRHIYIPAQFTWRSCCYQLSDFHKTGHNWQKWKSRFLACPCHRVEAVGRKSANYAKEVQFLWICEIWGNFVKIWYNVFCQYLVWLKCNSKYSFAHTSMQGSETSGIMFLPGRMEETGKKMFLPVSSGRNWKKVEETGRNTCSQMWTQTKFW